MRAESEIRARFPDGQFYWSVIDFETRLGGTGGAALVADTMRTDPLAAHLHCLPTAFVMHKKLPPSEGAFYLRLFEREIRLSKSDLDVYTQYYPTDRILLWSIADESHVWLHHLIAGRSPTKAAFSLS